MDFLRRVEAEVRQACLQALPAADDGNDVEYCVILRHPEVMHHAVVGQLEPDFALEFVLLVELVVGDVAREQAFRGVGEGAHGAGTRIDLRVGGEGRALHLALKVRVAQGLQGDRVQHERRAVFLQRQELAAIHHDVGVGGAAVAACDARIVGERVTVGAEQGAAGALLRTNLSVRGAALLEVEAAVGEGEHGDHAVAVEPDVVAETRGQLGIGRYPVEGAIDVRGDLALDFEVLQVHLEARGRVESCIAGARRELGHCRGSTVILFWGIVAPGQCRGHGSSLPSETRDQQAGAPHGALDFWAASAPLAASAPPYLSRTVTIVMPCTGGGTP